MTSFFVRSIEVISLTGLYQCSPKFVFIVAETILYKKYDIYYLSFWWRHHSEILD